MKICPAYRTTLFVVCTAAVSYSQLTSSKDSSNKKLSQWDNLGDWYLALFNRDTVKRIDQGWVVEQTHNIQESEDHHHHEKEDHRIERRSGRSGHSRHNKEEDDDDDEDDCNGDEDDDEAQYRRNHHGRPKPILFDGTDDVYPKTRVSILTTITHSYDGRSKGTSSDESTTTHTLTSTITITLPRSSSAGVGTTTSKG